MYNTHYRQIIIHLVCRCRVLPKNVSDYHLSPTNCSWLVVGQLHRCGIALNALTRISKHTLTTQRTSSYMKQFSSCTVMGTWGDCSRSLCSQIRLKRAKHIVSWGSTICPSSEDGGANVSPHTISRICGRDSDVARAYALWGGCQDPI